MRYVIIGNSAAAVGCVEGIRQTDKSGEITLITDEPHHTYSRPLISYLLQGKTTIDKMRYRCDDFYTLNRCTLLTGSAAVKISRKERLVMLDNGKSIPYDKLTVATGSSAFVPPFEGLDTVENKFTFMSLSDAQKLDEALSNRARVLIVGAGLVGLKCAEGIRRRVREVTVVDLASRILPAVLDESGAETVKNHLERNGLSFKLGTEIVRFCKDAAYFGDGEKIGFDILVLAAGVRPNTALLQGIAKIDKGIVINEKSETSAEDIYAAGDCTQSADHVSGQSKIMAVLPNAYMQGECAGINMAGGEKVFNQAIPMNAVGFFGLHILTAGNYTGKVYSENENASYKKLFYSDNRLNGYILIGNVERAGIYTNLIRERTPLDTLDFPLICKSPGLMAFSHADRAVRLGGGL